MDLKKALGESLRKIRMHQKLTQEDFSEISSRTYLSSLERGIYSPTIEKLDAIASVLGVHPVTVLVSCYLKVNPNTSYEDLLKQVELEIKNITSDDG